MLASAFHSGYGAIIEPYLISTYLFTLSSLSYSAYHKKCNVYHENADHYVDQGQVGWGRREGGKRRNEKLPRTRIWSKSHLCTKIYAL